MCPDGHLLHDHCLVDIRMLTTCRGMAAGRAACILIAVIFTAWPALGQFTGAHVPEKLTRGESANLFATWASGVAVDGFVIQIPPGCEMDAAAVLKNAFHALPVTLSALDIGRYEVRLAESLEREGELVFQLRACEGFGDERVVITPFRLSGASGRREALDADRITLTIRHEEAYADPENRVLSFADSDGRPLPFQTHVVPSLDLSRGFVASFWMKSTGLNEVIFSTWDGDENHGYPVELIVGPAGRLRYFRGRPGMHQSLGSNKPISDGEWHHVSVMNEPEAGWMRLQVDGQTIDSLYSATPSQITMDRPPVLGGRIPGPNASFDGMRPFSGFIDAFHILHTPGKGASVADPLELEFDHILPEDLFSEQPEGVRLVRSNLSFHPNVDGFSATLEGDAVLLRWHARPSEAVEFLVERSRDGRQFQVIQHIPTAMQSGEYQFRDGHPGEGVAYYRLRQVFTGGGERLSSTIKIGMGGGEEARRITLVGNFPNPFNNTTTISYVVKEQAHVGLSVWDVSGQVIRQLEDRTQPPGFYEVQFDADDLPSGTYFVRLHSDGRTKSHKMILMK